MMTLTELVRKEVYIRMADRPTKREQDEYEEVKKQLALYSEEEINAEYAKIFG